MTAASAGDPVDPATRHARALLEALGLDSARCEAALPPLPAPLCPAREWARSGAMALTGPSDGPPGFAAGPLASAARGAGLALAALAPGRGFDTLDAPALLGERAALFGFERRGAVSCGGSAQLLPTRDGWLGLNLPRDDDWRLVAAWLEREWPAEWAQRRDWAALAEALVQREAAPLVARGREIGLAVALAERRPSPEAAPFRLDHATAVPPRASARRRPPRVLDLSTLWAGPLAGSLLAAAGFEVAKVESPARPDGARGGEPAFFALLNADKHPCALDLTTSRDRAVFEALLEGVDVVLESARPRALAQLGFDARTWVEARPGRLWASITGYGRDHEWIAFGDDAAIAAGLAFEPDGRDPAAPRFCADAVADPLTGLTAAVAIAGLEGRGPRRPALALPRRRRGPRRPTARRSGALPAGPRRRDAGRPRDPRRRTRGRAGRVAARASIPRKRAGPRAAVRRLARALDDALLIRDAEVAGRRLDLRCDDGRILELGPGLARRAGEPIHEARGGALLPGLHDQHLHLFALAAALGSVDCGPPRTADPDALARALRGARPRDGWIRGTGYFESVAGPLDRARLDALMAEVPVRIQHRSGVLWHLNSAAIEALGLDDPARAPRSSPLPEVERDASGRATGRLFRADTWLREALPRSAPPDLATTAQRLAAFGLTRLTDASVRNDRAQHALFVAARASGALPQRLELMGDDSLSELAALAASEAHGEDHDGSGITLGARKFLLDEPALPDLDVLVAEIEGAHRGGRACAFHCATRVELHFALAALEAAGTRPGDRIEHASVAPLEAVARVKRLGLRVVTQPNFGFERGDDYHRDVEPRDRADLYRLRSWLEAGVPLAGGTDAPYGDPDPWRAMRAAVDRRTRSGIAFGASEAISPEAALALFAPPAALALVVGQSADLCLLDRPWREAREDLSSDRVAATFCAGRPVFAR